MQILGFGGREQLKRAIRCCPIVVGFDRILQQKWRIQNQNMPRSLPPQPPPPSSSSPQQPVRKKVRDAGDDYADLEFGV
jgi:hypothetical protein